jgi:hypothetical protein
MDPREADPKDLIERVTAELRRPLPPQPERVEAVMRRVVSARPARRSPYYWSVFVTGAIAAGLLFAVFGTRDRTSGPPKRTGGVGATAGAVTVRFTLELPQAKRVAVVGDFNGWDSTGTALVKSAPGGRWSVTLELPPGNYHYLFLVDGRHWMADPTMPHDRDPDYGSANSIITVL